MIEYTGSMDLLADLVTANHILANENVLDAFGHVSVRDPENPERYYLSCSRSPALVERDDIMHFNLASEPLDGDRREAYLERFIHGAIYAARPNVGAVVHSHADEVLPYTVTGVPLRPISGPASKIGRTIPVWDIDEHFGPETDLLVRNQQHGADLAKRLGEHRVVLMRGHGCAIAAATLREAVGIGVYLPRNAHALTTALQIGAVKYLSDAEIATMEKRAGADRAWEYWSDRARRAGASRSSP